MTAEQEHEDSRLVAIHRLVAVRRFAQGDAEPCQVLEGLFVGSIGAARNLDALRARGVTHVVNASPLVPCFHRKRLRYKAVPVFDDAEEDIARFFHDTNRFIGKGRRKGAVLVHCFAGQSRSVALVLAYLVMERGLRLEDALALVRKARPGACPNAGFMRQLGALGRPREPGAGTAPCGGARCGGGGGPGGVSEVC